MKVNKNVDKLAEVNAAIAKLDAEAKALKAKIIAAAGDGNVVMGLKYKASVAVVEGSIVVDNAKLVNNLKSFVSASVFDNAKAGSMKAKAGFVRVSVLDL